SNVLVPLYRAVSSSLVPSLFLLIIPRPPRSTLFPYTTLFRSHHVERLEVNVPALDGIQVLKPPNVVGREPAPLTGRRVGPVAALGVATQQALDNKLGKQVLLVGPGQQLVLDGRFNATKPWQEAVLDEFQRLVLDVAECRAAQVLEHVRRQIEPARHLFDLEFPSLEELGVLRRDANPGVLHPLFEDGYPVRVVQASIKLLPVLPQALMRLVRKASRVLQNSRHVGARAEELSTKRLGGHAKAQGLPRQADDALAL